MKEIEQTGRTVDEAVQAALDSLGISMAEAQIEVIEEPSKGILSILGSRLAKVRVTVKEPVIVGMESRVKDFLNGFVERLGLQCDLEFTVKGKYLWVSIEGEEMGLLIGKHGHTLNALQYITNMVANREISEKQRVVVDINSYRIRREEVLTQLASRLARKVKLYGKPVELEPMNPHERRVIHVALQGERGITTYSEGEEPNRRIVIAPNQAERGTQQKYSQSYAARPRGDRSNFSKFHRSDA